MKSLQAFRYELDPNNVKRTLLSRHAGTARFAYNWGLRERLKRFQSQQGKAKFTNSVEQHRELNRLKRTEFPWMYEVSKCAPQEALRDLDRAWRNFWRDRTRKRRKAGLPKPRRKGVDDRFRLTGIIQVKQGHVLLPRIGGVRTKESTAKFDGRILSATIRREADRWYVSLQVERKRPDPKPVEGPVVGIDVGLECFAKLSDGTSIESPKPLLGHLEVLRRRSKKFTRTVKGSGRRRKAAVRLARVHRRIRNIRKDFIHKAATALAKTKSVVVVEGLNVAGMMQNRRLARAISDAGWAEFRRQLLYKTAWYGSRLVVAPRFFPSTKMCSECGHVQEAMPLAERVFRCRRCGLETDRDLNAARNLEKYGATGSSPGSDARGDPSGGGPGSEPRSTSHGSMNREANPPIHPVG